MSEQLLESMRQEAHPDSLHLVEVMHAMLTEGRTGIVPLWAKLTALKSVLDGRAIKNAPNPHEALKELVSLTQKASIPHMPEAEAVLGPEIIIPR